MDREELLKIVEDDELGLLNVKAKPSASGSADERLLTSFKEITDFVRKHRKEPEANKNNIQEMKLFSRLAGLREDQVKAATLAEFDEYGLLSQTTSIDSIDDIFSDDDLGLLKDEAESIFTLKHVKVKEASSPDYIARRKPCENFEEFENLFKQCQEEIAMGRRRLSPFKQEKHIKTGRFFVLKGVLLYVAGEGERESGSGEKYNARLHCIFENGTESDMLLRSLAAELYKDGRGVSDVGDEVIDEMKGITDEDQESGFIYVLRSLSSKSEIQSIQNLYKIGFSRIAVEERIKNASQEPTFLLAPVSIVSVYKCFNLNPQKLELLLHSFFGTACLDIDVFDSKGRRYIPREWFVAPLNIISLAIDLVLNEEIVHYRYNPATMEIEQKVLSE